MFAQIRGAEPVPAAVVRSALDYLRAVGWVELVDDASGETRSYHATIDVDRADELKG